MDMPVPVRAGLRHALHRSDPSVVEGNVDEVTLVTSSSLMMYPAQRELVLRNACLRRVGMVAPEAKMVLGATAIRVRLERDGPR
jgi:hypothetical protein